VRANCALGPRVVGKRAFKGGDLENGMIVIPIDDDVDLTA